jgi:hypothetical protein
MKVSNLIGCVLIEFIADYGKELTSETQKYRISQAMAQFDESPLLMTADPS